MSTLELVYAPETISMFTPGPSVFLAGPTPRNQSQQSWRPEAVEWFEKVGFTGTLFLPEPRDGKFSHGYEDQIEWEHKGFILSSVVMFWVPRDLSTGMYGFTTNVEFGLAAGRALNVTDMTYGRPDNADKCKYLDLLFKKFRSDQEVHSTLESLVRATAFMAQR
ncbi:MAG: nucleoside 2-deoxyribosyltransferase domain-containing protein [Armatimonadetes bacterium]|nr:nucleoside 2-deoxyribosyltransferase domain-containing protein [Armatimonadota bacterium]